MYIVDQWKESNDYSNNTKYFKTRNGLNGKGVTIIKKDYIYKAALRHFEDPTQEPASAMLLSRVAPALEFGNFMGKKFI